MKKNRLNTSQYKNFNPLKPAKQVVTQEKGKKDTSKIWRYLQWLFSLIFIVASLEFFKDGYIPGGALCLLFGISICPTPWDILREKGVRVHLLVRILVPAFLFLAAAFSMPLSNVREEMLRKEAEELTQQQNLEDQGQQQNLEEQGQQENQASQEE